MPSQRDILNSVRRDSGRYTRKPRIVCPLCDAYVAINADGTLCKHRMPGRSAPGMSWNYPLRAGPVCKMSNL